MELIPIKLKMSEHLLFAYFLVKFHKVSFKEAIEMIKNQIN